MKLVFLYVYAYCKPLSKIQLYIPNLEFVLIYSVFHSKLSPLYKIVILEYDWKSFINLCNYLKIYLSLPPLLGGDGKKRWLNKVKLLG